MLCDFKFGFRQFLQKPAFSALVALLIAIGIGANVLIFGFIDTLLLKPLPVRDPENLWILQSSHRERPNPILDFSYGQYEEVGKNYPNLFSAVMAEQTWGRFSAYPSGENGQERLVMTQMVSPNYFRELNVRAYLGRVLDEDDTNSTQDIPAVLSYQFWRSRFGGRRDILSQTIRISNFPFKIVGILPRDFHSIDIERAPDVRLPVSAALWLHGKPIDDPRLEEYKEGFHILVRLRPGVDPGIIEDAIGTDMRRLSSNEYLLKNASLKSPMPPNYVNAMVAWFNDSRLSLGRLNYGFSNLRIQFATALKLLMGGVVLLLITVCANVMGLLLARGEQRRKDLAVRLSIGAGRWRILRQLFVENLALAVPGGLAGLILAYALAPAFLSILPPARSSEQLTSPQILTVTPDVRGVVFCWIAVLLSVCFFGLFPAWRATGLDLSNELKGASALPTRSRAALLPVAIQIALSTLLLVSGGLMLRTYWNLEHVNAGFDRDHVAGFTLFLKDAHFTAEQAHAYRAELEDRVRALSGVRSVAYSSTGLLRNTGFKMTFTTPGTNLPGSVLLNCSLIRVTPAFFDTLGIPILRGRTLTSQDATAVPQGAVVNRSFQQLLYPGLDPLGQGIVIGHQGDRPPSYQVVGLVESSKFRRMDEPLEPILYEGLADSVDFLILYVRTTGQPQGLLQPIRTIIRNLRAGVSVVEAGTLEQDVQASLWQERLVAALAMAFSFVALLLAGIGIYGTLAYSVARRQRELGIRIAIGAQVRHLVEAVCGRTAVAIGLGILVGWLAGAFFLRFAQTMLFEVQSFDQLSFGAAALAVILCATLAAVIPIWRTLRTNTSKALREQ